MLFLPESPSRGAFWTERPLKPTPGSTKPALALLGDWRQLYCGQLRVGHAGAARTFFIARRGK